MLGERVKRKKVSKNKKSAWRKHTDVQDVENFLDEKRDYQILGVDKLSSKSDSELFLLDTEVPDVKVIRGKPKTKREKKLLASQPAPYELTLVPRSAVEDPIKRNRVRTREERAHPARKAKDAKLAAEGKLRQRQLQALNDRKATIAKRRKQAIKDKKINFNIDVWNNESSVVDDSWLGPDAVRQCKLTCKEFKVKPPSDLTKPRSKLDKIEVPHPGLSYNPSLADHKDLIEKVVDKELKMLKQEEHIDRVTAPFKKKSRPTNQNEWVEEVMESLGMGNKENVVEVKEEEEEDNKETVQVTIAKKNQPKMKTRKQRRTQIRLRDEAQRRKYEKMEKRKISDIYQLRAIVSKIDKKTEENEKKSSLKRQAKEEYESVGTKRLGSKKYEDPLEDFTVAGELSGSLRKLRAKSTLLRDRFYSLQKRNILEPTTKIFKTKKRKVKVFTKRDHRLEEDLPHKARQHKRNKIKFITNA